MSLPIYIDTIEVLEVSVTCILQLSGHVYISLETSKTTLRVQPLTDIVLLIPSLYVLIALRIYINIRETEFRSLSFISISNPRVTTLVVVYTNIS